MPAAGLCAASGSVGAELLRSLKKPPSLEAAPFAQHSGTVAVILHRRAQCNVRRIRQASVPIRAGCSTQWVMHWILKVSVLEMPPVSTYKIFPNAPISALLWEKVGGVQFSESASRRARL